MRCNYGNCSLPRLNTKVYILGAGKASGGSSCNRAFFVVIHERNNGAPVALCEKFSSFKAEFGPDDGVGGVLDIVKRETSAKLRQSRRDEAIALVDDCSAKLDVSSKM